MSSTGGRQKGRKVERRKKGRKVGGNSGWWVGFGGEKL